MANTVISVTEVTVVTGKKSKINFDLDGRKVSIIVPVEIKAHFDEQFSRNNPSVLQKKKYATVLNLMRLAYLQGRQDAAE